MAYQAIFFNDGQEPIVVHSPVNPDIKLHDTVVNQDVKAIDTFSFSIDPSNPGYSFINEMLTRVEVIDMESKEIEFEGRILKRSGSSRNLTTKKAYQAENYLAYLNDTKLMKKMLTDKPSTVFRFMINRHNALVADEPHKQFAVGIVEIDTYIAYGESSEAELVRVELREGDTATIKPSTQYIYDWDGSQLPIASYAKGVAHKISGIRTLNGVKQYQLSRTWPTGVTTVEGFINESDIVEAQTTITAGDVIAPGEELPPGTKFKIRNGVTTYYGASDGGGPKTIPTEYRSYIYTVSSHGLINGMYGLLYNGTVIAWLPPGDIVQVDGRDFDVVVPPEQESLPQKVGGRYPEGTKVKIKNGVTTYYWSSDGTGPTTIPENYRNLNYTIREWSSIYKRYAIYHNGVLIAWANESDLDFGTIAKPNKPIKRDKPVYTEKNRIITVEMDYQDTTLSAIRENLLQPFNAELEYTVVEGVRTLHIRNVIETETDEMIKVGLNMIDIDESFDPTNIYTGIIPLGNPPDEDEGDDV